MSRKSRRRRKRARQKAKYANRPKLPMLSKVSTAAIIEELQRRVHILADVIAEQSK
jgi:hypothetical protein